MTHHDVPVPITRTPVVGKLLSYHTDYDPITYAGYIWLICMCTLIFAGFTYIGIKVWDHKHPKLLASNFVDDEEKL